MTQNVFFKNTLLSLKDAIDSEVAVHTGALIKDAQKNYTPYSYNSIDAYCQVLLRGGKRIRGSLTMVGYTMCGGTNTAMITTAAAAIEMIHAYVLVLDDIMDKSSTRRGGDTAHVSIAKYHAKQHFAGDSYHFGESGAINGAVVGEHYAQTLVANLDTVDAHKLHALKLMNNALQVTGHGQINDIYNEASATIDDKAIDDVYKWKTAHYTFLNPLQFGMALAGANNSTLASVYDYSMHAGRAFQITDDILGTFASKQQAGKDPVDDTRTGKRTLLAVEALKKADRTDKNFLIRMLGNPRITQAEFKRIKQIYQETGALKYANDQAKRHINLATTSLEQHIDHFSSDGYTFLHNLVQSLDGRSS